MVLYSQLPIYRDCYMLLTEIYQATSKFSKDYKYSLGQDIKRDALSMFRHLHNANRAAAGPERAACLDGFLGDFELLKIELRLCADLGILSVRKLAQLSLVAESVLKQATAWRSKAGKRKQGESPFD